MADSLGSITQYEKAIKYYDSAIKLDPNLDSLYRGKGYCYFYLGKIDESQIQYNKALKINPSCLRCEHMLIILLAYKQQFNVALQKADSVLTLYADTGKKYSAYVDIMYSKGEIYSSLEDYISAETAFEAILKEYPDSAFSYYVNAEFNYNYGSKSKALKYINKAIEVDDKKAIFYFLKSKLYIVIKSYKEAFDIINKAIILDSTNGEYYGYRGSINYELAQNELAISDYKKAVELGAAKGFYATMLAQSYLAKELMDSMCIYTSIAKESLEKDTASIDYNDHYQTVSLQKEEYCNPNNAGYYYQRGIAAFNLNLYESAINYYTEGLKKFPNNSVTHNFRGNAYILNKQWKEAVADYRASLQHPEDLRATCTKRFSLHEPSATELYVKGTIASNYLGLSEAYLQMGNMDISKKYADSAIDALPISPTLPLYGYYNQLGRVQMARGYYDSATIEFQKVIGLMPNNPIGYINMAITLTFMSVKSEDNFAPYGISGLWGDLETTGAFKNKPPKLSSKQKEGLETALSYCNRAITISQNKGDLYFVRAYIKYLIKDDDACTDMQRAKVLGFGGANDFINIVCK